MARTDWQMGDTVQPADLNQIGQEINEALSKANDPPVKSVNTKTGDVVLTAADVGAETPAGAQAKVDSHANKTFGAHKASAITIDDVNNHFSSTNVEGALEELFQFANDGKTAVANAITAKGVSASPTDTFAALATKIGQIETGKKWAKGTAAPVLGKLQVSGLAFRPRIVIAFKTNPGTVYRHTGALLIYPNPELLHNNGDGSYSMINSVSWTRKDINTNAEVTYSNLDTTSNGSFTLTPVGGTTSDNYIWYAFE